MSDHIDLSGLGDVVTRRELRLDQYLGAWAVDESRFAQLLDCVRGTDLLSHVLAAEPPQNKATADLSRDADTVRIRQVSLEGTLTKFGSSFSAAGSMVRAKREIRRAANDGMVDAILLSIDSPGGTVAGTQELAEEIARARESKPVWAYVEDLAASAAYWLVSQCDRVFANTKTALIGSIGTYTVLYDFSQAAEKAGIQPIVISSGGIKGQTTPGLPISDEVKAHLQGVIDATQAEFTDAIAKGRELKTDDVKALADGRVYMAAKAVELKLIDGIRGFEAVVEELAQEAKARRGGDGAPTSAQAEEQTVSESTTVTAPAKASYEQIIAACPGAKDRPDWICAQLAAGATLEEARVSWTALLQKERDEFKAKAEAKKPGVAPIGGGKRKRKIRAEGADEEEEEDEEEPDAEGEDPEEEDEEEEEQAPSARSRWERLVAKERETAQNRTEAVRRVMRRHPKLHRRLLREANPALARAKAI